MDVLNINGRVVKGAGRFRDEIGLPADLLLGHEEWMSDFVPGTLNVQFPTNQLPPNFRTEGLKSLDLNPAFPPHIYRDGSDVKNNTIRPNANSPQRGDVQLWRSVLFNHQTGTEHRCYLIRRVESGYRDKAEILGERNFKEELNFLNDQKVDLTIYADTAET